MTAKDGKGIREDLEVQKTLKLAKVIKTYLIGKTEANYPENKTSEIRKYYLTVKITKFQWKHSWLSIISALQIIKNVSTQ